MDSKNSDKIRLTGLWKVQSKAGGSYLSGRISASMKLLILPNTYKKAEGDPDFIAYVTPAKDEEQAGQARPKAAARDLFSI